MNEHLLVEPISERDCENLRSLFSESGPFVSARTLSDYWLYARLFSSTCLCVRVGASLAGALVAFRDQTPGACEIYIQDVAVSSEYRGRGVSLALFAALHASAQEWKVRRLWLTSEPENRGAINLWSKLGYVNQPADYQAEGLWVTRDLKGPGRDRVVFEFTLDP